MTEKVMFCMTAGTSIARLAITYMRGGYQVDTLKNTLKSLALMTSASFRMTFLALFDQATNSLKICRQELFLELRNDSL